MRTALEGHQTFCANWSTRNPSAVRGSSATLPQYSLWTAGFFAESKVRFWPEGDPASAGSFVGEVLGFC
jgi:hypothetical protein